MYVNAHTYYSFRYGTVSIEQLLEMIQEHGYGRVALTDINNTSAVINYVRLAPKYGVHPVVGIDFRNGVAQQFIGIAKNNEGFEELNRFLSQHLHTETPIPERAPSFQHAFVIYPYAGYTGFALSKHEFVGVRATDLNRLRVNRHKIPLEKLVALQTTSFRNKQEYNAHRLLRAIDMNSLLSKLATEDQGSAQDLYVPPEEMRKQFIDFPELLENATNLLKQCSVEFDFTGTPKNQASFTGSMEKDVVLLKKLCQDGLRKRYTRVTTEIRERLEKEISIICEKQFVSYFLINWDILNYARSKRYFYVGRGSGANSVVAYLLYITDVDPIELDLYFERFINLYRQNPPDFDIDFSWQDRDDIIDYIFKRFPHTAWLATYSTFQYRAVVRELGKVFGLPKHEIDVLAAGELGPFKGDKLAHLVLRYGQLIHGFPSHLSLHAGGILIANRPMTYYTATFMPPKGFPTTQFDMIVAEDVGLCKFDILSQRGLGKVKDTLDVIRENQPQAERFDIHDMPRFKEDPKIKGLLKTGKAIGCFYIESPAMRMLLKKLEVDHYLGLVAASSIIRPGVAKSGMMREYILRYRDPERRKQAHPVMYELMPETYGVMVYQEDVIKVAHHFAGLTLGEADALRRGMSGKYRSREEFQRAKQSFFDNCIAKGYTMELTAEVWRQVESFAGYAFAKGHSASYAVESYQALFLKAHYPLEYMVSVLNNGGGFYSAEIYIHEARMQGGKIEAPCVNKSKYEVTIQGTVIYLGFGFLKDLQQKVALTLIQQREVDGPFKSFDDFLDRIPISLEQITLLIGIDAFRFTGRSHRELLLEAHKKVTQSQKNGDENQQRLFRVHKQYRMPKLASTLHEDAFEQLDLLGFPLIDPFKLLREPPEHTNCVKDMERYLNKVIDIYGYLVTVKRTSTSKGQHMFFGTFLDQEGHFIDTTHFPDVGRKFPFRGNGVYRIFGKVVEEFGAYSIEVSSMRKLPYIDDPRFAVEDLDYVDEQNK